MLPRTPLAVAALIAGLVSTASAQLSSADKTFVMRAAQTFNYEIEAALLADKYSSSAVYRDYATRIANDQTVESGQLESAVADEDPSVRLPSGVSPAGQRQLDALKNARNVDAAFRQQIIAAETATLRFYQDYIAQPTSNSEVKRMAQQQIPTFQQQLDDAQQLPPQ